MSLLAKARTGLGNVMLGASKSLLRDGDHGGWVDSSSPWNFWQTGYTSNGTTNEVVYSCVQAYAKTIAQLPGQHLRKTAAGADELVTGPIAQVLRKPNGYQTSSDFLLNLVASILYEGNGYILAERSPGNAIRALHLIPPHACSPVVYQGEVFYHVSPEDVTGLPSDYIPARDVGHVRLHTPLDPLKGETPLYAAALAVKVNNNLMGHQATFFENMSRPSGILESDERISAEQMAAVREAWEKQSSQLNSGRVPILAWGFKWKPLSISSTDAQLIDVFNMSVQRIAAVYGVPLPLIGALDNATYNNVFNLMSFWKVSGLGFMLEHIEQTLGTLFALGPNERIEYDTNRLLRTDEATEMDALTKGVTGGVYAPNEARRRKGLAPVEGGDMPRVQQQMVPLDYEEPAPAPPPAIDAAAVRRELNRMAERKL